MKIFRERAGVLGQEPMWVGVRNGARICVDRSLDRLLNALMNSQNANESYLAASGHQLA